MSDYTYLISTLLLVALWVVLYLFRKDARREMWIMSLVVVAAGLFMQYVFWIKDWWQPITITGASWGIEDFLGLFGIGGATAVIYEELFIKKLYFKKTRGYFSLKYAVILLTLFGVLHGTSFFVFNLHSSISWIIATIVPVIIIYLLRPDLIINSIATGVILTIVGFLGFAIINFVQQDFIYAWWQFTKLTGIVILGVPLEDIVWFITFGMFIGPLYEFLTGAKLKQK